MLNKYISLAALLGVVGAQELQGLNATLAGNEQLSSLSQVLTQLQILPQLEQATNVTILAPNNEAFAKVNSSAQAGRILEDPSFLGAILLYHVVNGTYYSQNFTEPAFVPTMLTNTSYANVTGGQRVQVVPEDGTVAFFSGLLQNSTVTQADVNFTGGVIHIIDQVLTVPTNASSTALAANLTALYGALGDADLVEAVDTTPDVTIFAPANEAFSAIGSALGNISTEDLQGILTYHVVNGTVGYSTGLENGTSLQTLNGAELTIRIENGTVFVNSAKVIVPNVLVANGVVHVIDNVLNPSDTTASPEPSATQGSPAFPSASSGDLPFTTDVPSPSATVDTSNAPTAGSGGAASTSASQGGAMPVQTGMAGPAMLFGGAAVMMMNL